MQFSRAILREANLLHLIAYVFSTGSCIIVSFLCHVLFSSESYVLYVAWLSGPEAVLKPPLNLMCQQSQAFQPVSPSHSLGPPPVMMPPDPLAFSLCSPMPAKPLPHLQLVPSSPITVPPVSNQLPEEDSQKVGPEQDTTLEELCKPLYCKLCNVTLNSAQQAQAHYQVNKLYWKMHSNTLSVLFCSVLYYSNRILKLCLPSLIWNLFRFWLRIIFVEYYKLLDLEMVVKFCMIPLPLWNYSIQEC